MKLKRRYELNRYLLLMQLMIMPYLITSNLLVTEKVGVVIERVYWPDLIAGVEGRMIELLPFCRFCFRVLMWLPSGLKSVRVACWVVVLVIRILMSEACRIGLG